MADGSKDSVIAPAPEKEKDKVEYKIAELRDDGTAVVELPDGRVFVAEVKEGVELRKHAKVSLTNDGERDGVPTKAVITKVLS